MKVVKSKVKSLLLVLVALSVVICFSGIEIVRASELHNAERTIEQSINESSEDFFAKFDPYVIADKNNSRFYISKDVIDFATHDELLLLKRIVAETNRQIQIYNLEGTLVDSYDAKTYARHPRINTLSAYSNGVTKVETHWWGVKVYISKTDANNVGRLYEYGGLLASLASGPLGVLITAMGMGMSDIPGGFSFNVTWPQVPTLPLLATNPLTVATIIATWSWQ